MSYEIEAARIELELAEDAETVTAARILRWRSNQTPPEVRAWIERATMAIGRADRIRARCGGSE